ncbi:gamma-glutamyltransferase [Streptomyces sp. CC53]|uniref:gamma-glutamyltransferase n=1 Tax=unclassified Streptomyces TaxID=2593676 RepID=UPI0008DC7846|nr:MULTISPECIES: gamma-glutamyltransferase [unclassified Streptomyces]OII62107.1 gamma-glutamyltransferase [Streptomyces sp. CC53]
MLRRSRRFLVRYASLVAVSATALTTGAAPPPAPAPPPPAKTPVAVGHGGAVASVDADASAAGIAVLKAGGNAVDAAVATAAALGVTEPYSAGIGGGGYLVHYDARTRTVHTLDGRETAPRSATAALFLGDGGTPLPFGEAATSGLSVGVPGTPATWDAALDAWGTKSLRELLKPAERLARDGFVVDETFRAQTRANEERFRDFPASAELFLPGGALPAVGSVMRNPDLARTYAKLGRQGSTRAMYRGDLARDIVRTVRNPPVREGAGRTVRAGDLTTRDLAAYETVRRAPAKVSYRGLDVYGMAPSSSGGTTVGEALNILEGTDLRPAAAPEDAYLHRFVEASRIAFADRGRWVGDPAHEDVPLEGLLSQRFADARACLIKDDTTLTSPLPPGDPHAAAPGCEPSGKAVPTPYEGESTTHLTTADRWGNVVAYTLTIEQTGGSAITVPGRGFLLNNELTDFSFAPADPAVHDPNLPGPGKRPRSSMAPTIVLDRHDRPVLALGSPGGATIITTVLQTLTGVLDRGLPLVDAIAAPRASQRNGPLTDVEPGLAAAVRARLAERGHAFREVTEIGAATGVHRLPDGRWLAAAEKVRRGGGSALVVRPTG